MQPECKTGQRDVLCEPSLYLMQVAWLLGPCVHSHEKLLTKGEKTIILSLDSDVSSPGSWLLLTP